MLCNGRDGSVDTYGTHVRIPEKDETKVCKIPFKAKFASIHLTLFFFSLILSFVRQRTLVFHSSVFAVLD